MNANLPNDPTMARPHEQYPPTPLSGKGSRFWALVPCAGQGTRAATAEPKQYHPVAGRALVLHTLAAFAGVARLADTLVLLAPGDAWFSRLDRTALSGCTAVECGAATRAGTVRNGLVALRQRGALDDDWVLVHDAARCLVTPALIDRLIDACSDEAVGGLLAVPVSDTVKRAADGRVSQTVDRSLYWLAQTPQMFRLGMLAQALQDAGATVTDESSAIEALGMQPRLVEGDRANFKVTVAQDFAMAEAILRARDAAKPKEIP
jgi:2-C-methyl-D-erythritol 4-phosphate cytidylyltransferase